MSAPRFLTDEHVPGPFVAVLRSIEYDVLRAKDQFEEGTADGVLLDHAAETDRVVITCDRAFTVVDGDVFEDHAGVIYTDQTTLQAEPEDAAAGVEEIVTLCSPGGLRGSEFYLSDWTG